MKFPSFVFAACLAASIRAEEAETPVVAVSRPVLLEEGVPRSYVGVVRAAESVDVTARITGEIRRRCFEEGARVEKGRPLFELEDTACRANAAAAKAEVLRLETQLAFAEKEAARYRACLDEKGVSEADCELKEQERDVLRAETAAHLQNRPNDDPRFWADDVRPAGPRPILAAVHGDRIVGFTGPVDVQKSGRGWFTGICTDPECGGRGIATALFNLLMQSFAQRGAKFSTLFTGTENHAQKIYRRAGMAPARAFTLMSKPLE